MITDKLNLNTARKSLTRDLARRGCRDGIAISFEHDTEALDLRRRLYDSTVAGRRINIDHNPDAAADIDCFVKDSESDPGSMALLTVLVKNPSADPRRLWRMTKAWLYDRAEPGAVLSI